MRVAVVTFDGFNELDSLVAAHIINRVELPGWRAEITGPSEILTSMNGVVIRAQQPLEFAARADAVILGLVQGVPVCTDRKTQAWVEADTRRALDRVEPFVGQAVRG